MIQNVHPQQSSLLTMLLCTGFPPSREYSHKFLSALPLSGNKFAQHFLQSENVSVDTLDLTLGFLPLVRDVCRRNYKCFPDPHLKFIATDLFFFPSLSFFVFSFRSLLRSVCTLTLSSCDPECNGEFDDELMEAFSDSLQLLPKPLEEGGHASPFHHRT